MKTRYNRSANILLDTLSRTGLLEKVNKEAEIEIQADRELKRDKEKAQELQT